MKGKRAAFIHARLRSQTKRTVSLVEKGCGERCGNCGEGARTACGACEKAAVENRKPNLRGLRLLAKGPERSRCEMGPIFRGGILHRDFSPHSAFRYADLTIRLVEGAGTSVILSAHRDRSSSIGAG